MDAFAQVDRKRDRFLLRRGLADELEPLLGRFLDGETPAGARLLAGGRGATISVPLRDGGNAVLRRSLRGGLPARLVRDVYVGAPRPFAELEVTEQLRSMGLPVPEPLGAIVRSVGPALYRGAIATREIPQSINLWAHLQSASPNERRSACAAAVALVRRIVAAGVIHPDLNLKNLLVVPSAGPDLWLIDCDGVRVGATQPAHKQRALARLRRSAARLDPQQKVIDPAWLCDPT